MSATTPSTRRTPRSTSWASGSSGCAPRVCNSATTRRAPRCPRPGRRTAAGPPGAWCPRRSSSCSGRSATFRRWRSCCVTWTVGSSTSPRCATGARSTSAGRRARTRSPTGTTRTRAMPDASRSELPRRVALGVVGTWRRLNAEQRVAGVGALLLVVSTFGPFSFVEAAIVLIGLSVLYLLRKRAEGREFHVPFGDGTVIAAAGVWAGLLILIRIFNRPLGQGLLALVCAAVLIVAGLSERRKRPPDDLPEGDAHQRGPDAVTRVRRQPPAAPREQLFDPE